MSLIQWKAQETWNPFQELERMMDQWQDTSGKRHSLIPAIDVVEEKDSLKIEAEVPGLKKEDIKVSVDGNVLTIQGEKRQQSERKENGVLRTERTYGSFYRSLTVPPTIDVGRISAAYNNGVLELVLPKKEEAHPKQIDVQVK
jgi:HSP20 family protein